ncbi:MAG: hypothetical protein ACTHY8_05965 [Microbacterium gubbeenense]
MLTPAMRAGTLETFIEARWRGSMRSKKLIAAGLAMVALLGVSGCAGQLGADGRVAVVYLNAEGYYAGVERGLESTFDDSSRDAQIISTNGRGRRIPCSTRARMHGGASTTRWA